MENEFLDEVKTIYERSAMAARVELDAKIVHKMAEYILDNSDE